jgi:hypothetical protein
MVCRLLKSVESGWLPEDDANSDEQSSEDDKQLSVDGIVYLREGESLSKGKSHGGYRGVSAPYLYADLSRLPTDVAEDLDKVYRNPHASIEAKMYALLYAFPSGRYVVMMDNFENVIDPETREIEDAELREALGALLEHPQHEVKVVVTTRFVPHDLPLVRPELQTRLELEKGLASPYAENILCVIPSRLRCGYQLRQQLLALLQGRCALAPAPRARPHPGSPFGGSSAARISSSAARR